MPTITDRSCLFMRASPRRSPSPPRPWAVLDDEPVVAERQLTHKSAVQIVIAVPCDAGVGTDRVETRVLLIDDADVEARHLYPRYAQPSARAGDERSRDKRRRIRVRRDCQVEVVTAIEVRASQTIDGPLTTLAAADVERARRASAIDFDPGLTEAPLGIMFHRVMSADRGAIEDDDYATLGCVPRGFPHEPQCLETRPIGPGPRDSAFADRVRGLIGR